MHTSFGQLEGAIVFRVTDLQLAIQIDQLLKKHSIAKDAPRSETAKPKIDNGRAAKDPETKARVLNLLKERFSSAPFTVLQAAPLVKTALGVSVNTIRRSLKFGMENGSLRSDPKGEYHFLESVTTHPQQATDSEK